MLSIYHAVLIDGSKERRFDLGVWSLSEFSMLIRLDDKIKKADKS